MTHELPNNAHTRAWLVALCGEPDEIVYEPPELSCDKKDHRERSIAAQPNHLDHWKKLPKDECTLCQPIVNVLTTTGEIELRDARAKLFMEDQRENNCQLKDIRICLPLLQLLGKINGSEL